MNNLSISQSIQKLLKELQQLVQELKNDPIDFSQLELDLMKEKIRSIYDILNSVEVKKVSAQQIEDETITQPEPEVEAVQEEEQVTETIPELDINKEEEKEIEFEIFAQEDQKEMPPSTLLAAHAFKTSDKLIAQLLEKKINITLGPTKEHTGSFTQFTYEITAEGQHIRKKDIKDEANKNKDDFDELWSSL